MSKLPKVSMQNNIDFFTNHKDGDMVWSEEDIEVIWGQWILCSVINSHVDGDCIKGMYRSMFLQTYIPEFENIHKLTQKKKHGKDLLEHMISVYHSIDPVLVYFKKRGFDPWDNDFLITKKDSKTLLLFTAFFHDIGKVVDVESHPRHSYRIVKTFLENCELFLNIDGFETIVSRMILLHMRPLGYQRDEPWSDNAVGKFIRDSSGKEVAILITIFGAMDKYASSQKLFYLDKLIELCQRINDYET